MVPTPAEIVRHLWRVENLERIAAMSPEAWTRADRLVARAAVGELARLMRSQRNPEELAAGDGDGGVLRC